MSAGKIIEGGKVLLLKDIYDDGEDHHPPGYLAHAGEIMIVRCVGESSLGVSHKDVTDNSFTVYAGEYEKC